MRQRMRQAVLAGLLSPLVVLAACSEAEKSDAGDATIAEAAAGAENAVSEPVATSNTDIAGAQAQPAIGSSALPDLDTLEVSLPQLAYVYDFSWRLAAEDIGTLQRRHADLCEQQGTASCRLLGMNKTGEDADEISGELQLAVATRHARAFGALLEKEAGASGAEQLAAGITTEELSKQIVDTEARLRARRELRDRLMEVLRTRKGSVEELVEAERSVAAVNEEIDQAQSWLGEMEGRIAFSKVNLRYESASPMAGDFLAPVTVAFDSLGSILGWMFAVLIVLGALLAPVAGLVWALRRISRHNPPVTHS